MLDTVLLYHGFLAYVLVFGMLLAGSFGLPVPEDLALITAGVLISTGRAEIVLMSLICYLGIIAGDLIIYRVGWMAGPAILRRRWARRYFTAHRIRTLRENLERRTFLTILVARHLFYLRTATFLFCGAVRVSFTRFLIADALAALITLPIMLGLGYLFAEHYNDVMASVERAKFYAGVVGLIILLILYVRYRRRGTRSLEEV
jgi:membrane protein DedA with SNARE-associated domain